MRVCVVAEYYPRRRDPVLGVWAHRQALAARDAGAEVRVLVLERPLPPVSALRSPLTLAAGLARVARQPRRDVIDGIEVDYVRFVAPPRGRSYARWGRYAEKPLSRALSRLRARFPFDLVHAHYAVPAGDAAAAWCERERLPLVVSVHGGDVLGPLLQTAEARERVAGVLRRSAAVLCNSRTTLERAAALTGSDDGMRVLHLGARAPDPLPARRSRPAVAVLGHVVARKRHEDVLRAVAGLGGLGVVVIGDGPERPRLEALARELRVAVEWLGQLAPEDALRELARCHAMALPSEDEAFGVAYVEAMACGLPAIGCAGEGGPEEIAAAGPGMLLVPPRDPAALAEAIKRAVENPELGEQARATADEHFSWERCGRETVAAYEEVLAR